MYSSIQGHKNLKRKQLNKDQSNKKKILLCGGIKNIKHQRFFSICGRKSMVAALEDSRRLILPCIFSGG